jgi:FKBP-type peptidyl-prolyl cis-trans isomerase SlyD
MIENGAKITLEYTLKVDGRVRDTSKGRSPLVYVQGARNIIPGLEKAVAEMVVGQKKEVSIPPREGYGEVDPNAELTLPKTAFQSLDGLDKGVQVQGEREGKPFQATVKQINPESVVLDMNHPLAGKALDFEVELLEVANA